MRITQGQFSFLPDLTDAEIRAQVDHAIDKGWALSVEHTDDPHPRNTYWEMWGLPMFHIRDGAGGGVRGQRLPQGVSRPLHQGERVRQHARRRVDGDELHRAASRR